MNSRISVNPDNFEKMVDDFFDKYPSMIYTFRSCNVACRTDYPHKTNSNSGRFLSGKTRYFLIRQARIDHLDILYQNEVLLKQYQTELLELNFKLKIWLESCQKFEHKNPLHMTKNQNEYFKELKIFIEEGQLRKKVLENSICELKDTIASLNESLDHLNLQAACINKPKSQKKKRKK